MSLSTLKIRTYGDPVLREQCAPVREVGPGERMVIKAMIETMYQAKGVGLAAPQVGITQRLFVMDVGDGPMAGVLTQDEGQRGPITVNIKELQALMVKDHSKPLPKAPAMDIKVIDTKASNE